MSAAEKRNCAEASHAELCILHEDAHILVLCKATGIHSADLKDSAGVSMAQLLRHQFPELAAAAPKSEDCGLVNRLDFETSGCLLAAKSRTVWEQLHSQLQAGAVEKSYLALVEGTPPRRRKVHTFIGSRYRRARKVRVYDKEPGKPHRALEAHSEFKLRHSCSEHSCSLVQVNISTARRHQVRAHAAWLGHPLVGDELYGSTRKVSEVLGEQAKLPAFLLHADRIRFNHPVSGKPVSCEAPNPYNIRTLFDRH